MGTELGPVSEGTLRPQDLIPRFLGVLRELAPEAYQQVMMPGCGFSAFPSYAQEDEGSEWWQSDDCQALLESLSDCLDDYAPEDCYFGAHPGDGACFGFWPCEEY